MTYSLGPRLADPDGLEKPVSARYDLRFEGNRV